MFSTYINSAGLILDIAGVIMLFLFGLPNDVNRYGYDYIYDGNVDPKAQAKGEHYDRLSKVALGLLVVGFLLQLLSNFL